MEMMSYDLPATMPLSSLHLDFNGQLDVLSPDEDEDFCNFIMDAFLA
jgi:hypothetical protein